MMKPSVQDSAFAWLVCFASFINLVMIGGIVYCTGMFFIMFKETFDATDVSLALTTSINIAVMHLVCPFVGVLSDRFDGRVISMIGCILSTVGIATAAFATKVIHLQLGFGVLTGLGLGVTYNIGVTFINPYFNKYKRGASSIVMTGLGIGSLMFPPVIKFFQDLYGWRGAMLMLAGLNVHTLVSSSVLRPFHHNRKHNEETNIKDFGTSNEGNGVIEKIVLQDQTGQLEMKDNKLEIHTKPSNCTAELNRTVSLLRNMPYTSACLCKLIVTFPLLITVVHFGNYAMIRGSTKAEVVNLYMMLGVSNLVSRPLSGFFAQLLKLNLALFIMLTLLANGLLTMLLPFMAHQWMLYGYAFLHQLLLGPCNTLFSTLIMEHLPGNLVPRAYGIFLSGTVPGSILGGPIAAWIYDSTGIYDNVFYFTGCLLILCGLIMTPSSYHIYMNNTKNTDDPSEK